MTFDSLTAIAVAVIFFATLSRTTFGFGEALIAMPLLSMLLNVQIAAPLMAMVSVTTALGILATDWKQVHSGVAWRLALASLLGIPLGMLLLARCPEEVVKGLLAVGVISFALYSLLGSRPFQLKNDRLSFAFGFIAGVLGGAYNTQGPPLVIYGALRNWSAQHFRATLQGFFLPTSLVIIFGHAICGRVTSLVGWYYLAALPLVLVSLIVGRWLHHRIDAQKFSRLIYVLLVGLGLMLLVNSLSGLGALVASINT